MSQTFILDRIYNAHYEIMDETVVSFLCDQLLLLDWGEVIFHDNNVRIASGNDIPCNMNGIGLQCTPFFLSIEKYKNKTKIDLVNKYRELLRI